MGARNPWLESKLPRGPAAVLASLHLRHPRPDALDRLDDAGWRAALDFADRSQLTLIWREAVRERMPEWVRARTGAALINNGRRLATIEGLYRALDLRLRAAGIAYIALKGLTQCPQFGTPAGLRVQFDIDLWVPRASLENAAAAVRILGFEPMEKERGPEDHLPPFVKLTGWQWRGDFFDPEMPVAVELHFRFWDPSVERIPLPDVENFAQRRTARPVAGIELPVLSEADGLGYTALHLLRHVLRGSARPFHVYELAAFLERHAADDAFWSNWRTLHSPQFRRLQAVVFRLAEEWFGCSPGSVAEEEIANLPAATRAWFDDFALSPALGVFYPHKDELWLHLSLLESWRDKLAAARLRLLPLSLPGQIEDVHTPAGQMPLGRKLRRKVRYGAHVAARLCRHLAALPHTARTGWKIMRRPNS